MPDFREYQGVDFTGEFLAHYGKGHLDGGNSGRYPWGSGENGGGATRSARDRFKNARTHYRVAKKELRAAKENLTWVSNNGGSTKAEKGVAKRELAKKTRALEKAEAELRSSKSNFKETRASERKASKKAKNVRKANEALDEKEAKLKNVTSKDLDQLSDKDLQDRINRLRQEDQYRQSIGQDSLSKQRKDKDKDQRYDANLTKKEDLLANVSNKEISKMSDQDLNDRINRLRQEDTYRQLIGQKTLSQLRKEKDLPKEILKEAGATLAKNGLNALVNKVIIPTATGHIIYTLAQGRRNAENAEIEAYNKAHPDDQRQLKADVDYVSTVFKDAKFLSTKGKNDEGGGKNSKNKGGQDHGDGQPLPKDAKNQKQNGNKNVNPEDAKKVVKDMVDMSGAPEIVKGAADRMEKERIKKENKAKGQNSQDTSETSNLVERWKAHREGKDVSPDVSYETAKLSKNEQKELSSMLNKATGGSAKTEDRDIANNRYTGYTFPVEDNSPKPKEKKEKDYSPYSYGGNNPALKYESTPATYDVSRSEKDRDDAINRAAKEYKSKEYITFDSTPATYETAKENKKDDNYRVTFDYNNNSTYTTEGSSDKPYKRSKAEREATAGSSTFEKPTATDKAIDRAAEEYSRQSAPTKQNNSSSQSSQKLDIFYDSNPGQFSKKEQKEFSSAIASVTSILRSIGSSTPKDAGKIVTKQGKQTSSSDAIGRLKQNETAWEAIAKSVSPEVRKEAEKISQSTTDYTLDLLEKNRKILDKYTR